MNEFFRNNSKKIWIWLPALLMLVLIFLLSAENGYHSNRLSMRIAVKLYIRMKGLTGDQVILPREPLLMIDRIIRKIGHVAEYAILSCTVMLPLYLKQVRKRILFCGSVCICLLFAALDEFHQLFTFARTAKITDILIDFAGILTGIGLFFLIIFLYGVLLKHRKNKNR